MSENRVRARRDQLGLTQKEVAAAIAVSRQTLNAIEAGRAVPSVVLALRLARTLGCDVDSLFSLGAASEVTAKLASTLRNKRGRVLLGWVRNQWVAHPLESQAVLTSYAADGFVRAPTAAGRALVELSRPLPELSESLFVGGCAPGLSVLADKLNHERGPGRFRWLMQSNRGALQALQRGHVHLAGVHFALEPGELARTVPRYLPTSGASVYALATWEAGLLVPRDNPKRIRGVEALEQPRLRVALRESGSGARSQLERLLKGVGLDTDALEPRAVATRNHMDVAHAVALGAADVGFAIRAAALTRELDFVPLLEERFDLIVPSDLANDARVLRLLDMLNSEGFRRELSELGYDTRLCGKKLLDVSVG